MKRLILCGLLVAIFMLTGIAAYAETMPDIQAHHNCKYCNMDRQTFAHSRMLIEFTDGSSTGLCSIHCAALDLAQSFNKQVKAILVGDYNTKKLINAETAYWVIGGDKPGVMTKVAKWAFADKKDAEAFIKEHGGKIANFDEAMKATFQSMYEDTKMIWAKRAKMKQMKEMQEGKK